MADTKGVRFAETPPGKSKRWSTNGDRPMRSPYPFPHIDPWSTISVLSIDGGRSRGYSSLVMMQALMEKVGEIERGLDPHATSSIHSSAFGPLDEEICAIPNPSAMPTSGYRPCHYFDYIAGVGTGGIIAMLLGRYRMSVGEAMEKYRDICAMAVERQLTSPQPKLKGQEPLLSTNPTTLKQSDARTVSLVPAWPGPNEYEGNLESDPKRCRTIVCGCDFRLQPFRSYPRSGQRRYDINDVILRCVPEDIAPGTPVDAKHYYSNPSRTVLKEISSLHDHEWSTEGAIDLLSIGAGINEPVSARANELQYLMCRQIQRVHKELSDHRPGQFPHLTDYRRLDPLPLPLPPNHHHHHHNLDDISLHEFQPTRSTFGNLEESTNRYVQTVSAAQETLHDVALALVEQRILRAETVRWERWALGVRYRCPMFRCDGRNQRFEDRAGFWEHMGSAHGTVRQRADRDGDDEEEERVGRGRMYNVYEAMGRTREGPRKVGR